MRCRSARAAALTLGLGAPPAPLEPGPLPVNVVRVPSAEPGEPRGRIGLRAAGSAQSPAGLGQGRPGLVLSVAKLVLEVRASLRVDTVRPR